MSEKNPWNIRTLAKKAGVSSATISRALSPKTAKLLKPKTYEKVMKVIHETGFAPNQAARNLREGKRNTIGLMVAYYDQMFEADYYPKLLSGVIEALKDSVFDFRLIPITEGTLDEKTLKATLDKNQVAGAILHRWSFYISSIHILENSKLPLILINDRSPSEVLPCVYCHNFQGGYQVGQYLAKLGHKKLALIEGVPNAQDNRDRVEGFLKALSEYKLEILERNHGVGHFLEPESYEITKRFMLQKDPPTAIFCLSDEMSLGVYRALKELNIRCPNDVSVVGYDDDRLERYITPTLTTVAQPVKKMAEMAAQYLLNQIEEGKLQKNTLALPVELKIRGSTGPQKAS